MKRSALWKIFTDNNPSFLGSGTVTMSAAGLRKLFDQTYEIAHTQGFANGKAFAEMRASQQPDTSLFGRIFGPSR